MQEAFVEDRKAEQPQAIGSGRSFGNGPDPQMVHGQFGLVTLPAGKGFLGCPISREGRAGSLRSPCASRSSRLQRSALEDLSHRQVLVLWL